MGRLKRSAHLGVLVGGMALTLGAAAWGGKTTEREGPVAPSTGALAGDDSVAGLAAQDAHAPRRMAPQVADTAVDRTR